MTETFDSILDTVNAKFSEKHWLDFEIVSFLDGVLKIKASSDFCYYHECEIEFSGVRYFHGPTVWGSNPLDGLMETLPETETTTLINTYKLETPCNAVIFNTDESFKVVIAATAIKVNFDTVYYYARENLGLHERIDENVHINREKS